MKKTGFIGLGIMGKHMARNLIKAGHSLVVYDINKSAVDELVQSGAKSENSPMDVATQCEIIITMLPNSPHVKEVVLGENGVIYGAKPGSVVIDMSSIAPTTSVEVYNKLKEKGIEMLDAPVSGGEPKAIDGTLAIMVGGKEEVFNDVKDDILLKMGASAVFIGSPGSGNVTKLANQIIVALNIAAMSEAMVFATKAGVDPKRVFEAIKGGLAGSTVLNAKMPMVLDRNFKPGFKIALHIKDLINAMETSHSINSSLILTSQVLEMMKSLKPEGNNENDHGSLVNFYEKLSDIVVKPE